MFDAAPLKVARHSDDRTMAEELGDGRILASRGTVSTDMVRRAADTAVKAGGDLQARRRCFLRICWPDLGRTQRQHISDHCWVVSMASSRLGRIVHLPEPGLGELATAGLFHDLGKCLIPEGILAKPTLLTDAERAVMSRHGQIGARIAAELGADEAVLRLVLDHHVPAGQTDKAAGAFADNQAANLLRVADALVSMISDRPYCPPRTLRQALAELRRCVGVQFDVAAVEAAHILHRVPHAA